MMLIRKSPIFMRRYEVVSKVEKFLPQSPQRIYAKILKNYLLMLYVCELITYFVNFAVKRDFLYILKNGIINNRFKSRI